jgi:hypothetical protein
MKHVSALCGQEVEFLNGKSGGKQSNHNKLTEIYKIFLELNKISWKEYI